MTQNKKCQAKSWLSLLNSAEFNANCLVIEINQFYYKNKQTNKKRHPPPPFYLSFSVPTEADALTESIQGPETMCIGWEWAKSSPLEGSVSPPALGTCSWVQVNVSLNTNSLYLNVISGWVLPQPRWGSKGDIWRLQWKDRNNNRKRLWHSRSDPTRILFVKVIL